MHKVSNIAAAKAARARQRMSNTSLTEGDVRTIRRARDAGTATIDELADQFGLGLDAVRKVAGRKTFRWVSEMAVSEIDARDVLDRILPTLPETMATPDVFERLMKVQEETNKKRSPQENEAEAQEIAGKADKENLASIKQN